MLNSRRLEKLKQKWFNLSYCEHLDGLKQEGISIQNVGGAYLIICIGIVLACIAWLMDFCAHFINNKL